jgi:hypothetical protein
MAGTIVARSTASEEELEAAGGEPLVAHLGLGSIGWKPATSARMDASNRCSGPPAGTWNARPAG